MNEISGEITSHLAALGAGTRDRLVFAILSKNPHFIEDAPVTDAEGVVRIDIANVVEGLLLSFRDGALERVRTTIRRDGDYYPFPRPAELISGLDLSAVTPQDVRTVLGDPLPEAALPGTPGDAGAPGEVRYPVEGGILSIFFNAEELVRVSVSRN